MLLIVHTANGQTLVRLKLKDRCGQCQGRGYVGLPTLPLVCPECGGSKVRT